MVSVGGVDEVECVVGEEEGAEGGEVAVEGVLYVHHSPGVPRETGTS